MVRKLANGTEEGIDDAKLIRSIYREEFVTSDMSFGITKAAWLQCLEKKIDYFWPQSIDTRDALLKWRSRPGASVVDQVRASPAQSAVAVDVIMTTRTWRLLADSTTWSW